MMMIVLSSIILMCLIVIVELWQSNKRLKKMLEQDKAKMARLFDENIALENKAFNVARHYELECD